MSATIRRVSNPDKYKKFTEMVVGQYGIIKESPVDIHLERIILKLTLDTVVDLSTIDYWQDIENGILVEVLPEGTEILRFGFYCIRVSDICFIVYSCCCS